MQPSTPLSERRNTLIATLRRRRKEAAIPITEVARQLNCRRATIHDLESGKHDPRTALLMRYGELLGLRLEWTTTHKPSVTRPPDTKGHL